MDAQAEPHRKRVRRYNIPGHAHFLTFSTYSRFVLLTNDTWREQLAGCVRAACDAHGFALWAYVFMPEHVHLLVKPVPEKYSISDFLGATKEPFSRWLFRLLQENRSSLADRLVVQERPGKRCHRFWQEGGGYDRNVVTLEDAIAAARYCHRNPVIRSLVETPEQWRWSSYRWVELNDRTNAPLRCDEWDEGRTAIGIPADSSGRR